MTSLAINPYFWGQCSARSLYSRSSRRKLQAMFHLHESGIILIVIFSLEWKTLKLDSWRAIDIYPSSSIPKGYEFSEFILHTCVSHLQCAALEKKSPMSNKFHFPDNEGRRHMPLQELFGVGVAVGCSAFSYMPLCQATAVHAVHWKVPFARGGRWHWQRNSPDSEEKEI